MDKEPKWLVRFAIKHRLLFNTKKDYCDFLGVKSIEDVGELKLRECVEKLNEYSEKEAGESLRELINAYSKAADKFRNSNWRKNASQNRNIRSETRKKLSIKLFEWAFAGDNPEALDMSKKQFLDENHIEILKDYCSVPGTFPEIDVCFTILMNWGIITVNKDETRDYPHTHARNLLMKELLEGIKQELPGIGIFNSIPELDFALDEIEYNLNNSIFPASVYYWERLNRVGGTVWALSQADSLNSMGIRIWLLSLPGIWIDNEEHTNDRFWIFPNNYQYAFCFTKLENTYILHPYEFFAYSYDDPDEDWGNIHHCVLVDSDQSKKIIENLDSKLKSESVNYFRPDFEKDPNNSNEIIRIKLKPLYNFQKWNLKWTEFKKIPETHVKFTMFSQVVEGRIKYKFHNENLIKVFNSLLAMDNEKLYLYDKSLEYADFKISIDEKDTYSFRLDEGKNIVLPTNLVDVLGIKFEGSKKEQYTPHKYSGTVYCVDRKGDLNDVPYSKMDRMKRFADVLYVIDMNTSVTIYHFGEDDSKIVIFFSEYSVGITKKEAKDFFNLREIIQ